MIRKCSIIFCDNEHGTGNVCFPDVDQMTCYEVQNMFVEDLPVRQLRKEAKKFGWGRVAGGDYCPQCMESGI